MTRPSAPDASRPYFVASKALTPRVRVVPARRRRDSRPRSQGKIVKRLLSPRAVGAFIFMALWLAVLPLPAHAALGAAASSASSDANHLSATQRAATPQSAGYTVSEMTTDSGTTVREYLGPNGVVFGVAWEGPTLPDLRVLLGSYFDRYAATQSANALRGARSPLGVSNSDLVVFSGGQLRAFSGRAYLPQAVPTGIDVNVIH
jgi:Protein of unknown function (DUF2844)